MMHFELFAPALDNALSKASTEFQLALDNLDEHIEQVFDDALNREIDATVQMCNEGGHHIDIDDFEPAAKNARNIFKDKIWDIINQALDAAMSDFEDSIDALQDDILQAVSDD